jgi:Mn2+/Fe2+ NRAMP family transporter
MGPVAADTREEPNLSMNPHVERDRALLADAKAKGKMATLGAFTRLSGPGWLQSAITLGGGSLSSSLYLGVLGGFMFLWLQPLAMVAGIVMLSAISYVTLSTGERPLHAINRHVSPILGWGWLLASMMANLVWSLPQFALATASFQQNLFPGIFGTDAAIPEPWNKVAVGLIILGITLTMGTVYSIGGRGVKIFEVVVKGLVGTTVLCFIGVVVTLSLQGVLDWGAIANGFVPRLSLLSQPVEAFRTHISQVPEQFQAFWTTLIVGQQRDVMISAAATAVGINMTFLFPYSMLRKGWDRDFRELAIFDLSTGLFFPFLMATSCVVIAAASQFNATPAEGFIPLAGQTLSAERQVVADDGNVITPAANLVKGYNDLLGKRLGAEYGADVVASWSEEEKVAKVASLPRADTYMAAMLVKRDAFNLADTLAPLTGKGMARYVFGLGVLGMAMGAATMLMLINGLCLCELFNRPAKGWLQRAGMAMVSVGILGPFFWSDAKMWLAIPTSVFAMTLLPFAYLSFFLLMNQKKFLGADMPKGGTRLIWNTLMAISAGLAGFASVWSLWSKLGWYGIGIVVVFFSALTIDYVRRSGKAAQE